MNSSADTLTLDKLKLAMDTIMTGLGNPTSPIQIFEDLHLVKTEQIRFPQSKKKRIRKKWAKNLSNWISYPDPNYYKYGKHIFCHPVMAEVLRRKDHA